MTADHLLLRVTDIAAEAKDAVVIELRDANGGELPPFTPGAHIELHLPNKFIRHYSLCNDARERDRYRIGVGLSPNSRGGSRFIHHLLRVGEMLRASAPRNNFPMAEGVSHHHFIAGGIGITPILSMIRACEAKGQDWHLTYLVRSRQRAAFLEELQPFAGRVTLHADDEAGGFLDVHHLVNGIAADAAIYCCGPSPLMTAVEAAAEGRPPELVRFEWFSAREIAHEASPEGFTVRLARSGITLQVPPDRTILETLEDNGIEAPFACREGICGTCEMRLLAGIPDHRDSVLSKAEQDRNETIIICCSRAKTDKLELDY